MTTKKNEKNIKVPLFRREFPDKKKLKCTKSTKRANAFQGAHVAESFVGINEG